MGLEDVETRVGCGVLIIQSLVYELGKSGFDVRDTAIRVPPRLFA